jgi:hypothetical protein
VLDEAAGMYFDYDFVNKTIPFEASTFFHYVLNDCVVRIRAVKLVEELPSPVQSEELRKRRAKSLKMSHNDNGLTLVRYIKCCYGNI